LPLSARKAASAKLFDYYNADCRDADKPSVLSLARYLDQMTSLDNPDIIREFMIFTNDLDATRGQSIRLTNPELVNLLAEDGYVWTDDTWLAKGDVKKRPARTRDFTWI
jgi:hypothetical protein